MESERGPGWSLPGWPLLAGFLVVAVVGFAGGWVVRGEPGWAFLGMAGPLTVGLLAHVVLWARRRRSGGRR